MRRVRIIFLIGILFFMATAAGMVHVSNIKPVLSQYHKDVKIILDAGHGGMDGGAVGVNNVIEKNINLNIVLKLRDMLKLNGFDVILTRDRDVSLHDESISGIARQKRSDMHNRLRVIEENPDAIFISIHQNKFEQSQSQGAQIFYSTNHPSSESLANQLQTSFKEQLQPQNKRETKQSGEELFLLYQSKIPAVLVECGFLSNPEECANLISEEYQNKVAFTVMTGIINYFINETEME